MPPPAPPTPPAPPAFPNLHLSRRDFLSTTVAAGAVIALPGCSDTTPQESAMQSDQAHRSHPFTLHINGQPVTLNVEPRTTLLDALREHLHFTGTKKGCDHGQCGACTVLINNTRINSCLTLAIMHAGDHITTIEGLASKDHLHPLQQAFLDHDAFQCGYCTPGQICSAAGLLQENHAKTDQDIRELMSGNLCRCGAYPNITRAIRQCLV